jgi:octaprenyl-diphosphate synthase
MTQLGSVAVLDRLAHVSLQRDVPSLAERLTSLDRWVREDLVTLDRDLTAFSTSVPRLQDGGRAVHAAANHLLDLKGKHLRPTCVALAAKFGAGFTERARTLAMAVELVHSATLLHDDVVDVAERRRGQPTACVVYGNAASIFAGDWLLVAALRKINAAGVPGLLEQMLAVIDEMIAAESLQLERRGQLAGTRDDYFTVAEGKTAALFRWAMIAGARCAELPESAETALDRFGLHLGVAFQAVDDELDFGTADVTGKDPLADLREGKLTFPLVVALEREPALRPEIEALLGSEEPSRESLTKLAAAVRATGALAATRSLAEDRVKRALAELDHLPTGPAREALVTVALASLERAS